MSIGFGAGDVIALSALAWKCWRMCKDSSEEYQRISGEVGNLKHVLDETRETVEENEPLSPTRAARLREVIQECQKALADLDKMLQSYESMNTSRQRTWTSLKFGLENIADIRSRIISHTTTLGALNQGIYHHGLKRTMMKVNKYGAEIRGGHRQGSVLSTRTATTTAQEVLEDFDEIKRELVDIGIPPAAVDEHKTHIQDWLVEAIESGALDEDPNLGHREDDEPTRPSLPTSQSAPAAATMPTRPSPWTTTRSEIGTEADTELSTAISSDPTLINDPAASSRREALVSAQPRLENSLFDAKWLQYADETGESPDMPPDLTPTTKRRKSSKLGALMFKLTQSDQKIIQAASDGNANEIENLLAKGVHVNTKDKWGWTAMSMAAYGGHVECAKVLMSHGASLDHEDVDGDTPLSLATKQGHRVLVMMIQEETTRRATEEDDVVMPKMARFKTR